MKARVGASSGYSVCNHPKNFTWDNQSLAVSEIIREWREPGAKHYLVATSDGRRFRLTLDETSGQWSVLEALNNS